VFLELRTYRFRAHSMYDPELYRDRGEVEQWKTRDPIDGLVRRLGLDADVVERIDADVMAEVDAAVAFAEAGTPEPVADLERVVTSEAEP
jgi:pyruvate dehydrogenase E1 component alpha subunit